MVSHEVAPWRGNHILIIDTWSYYVALCLCYQTVKTWTWQDPWKCLHQNITGRSFKWGHVSVGLTSLSTTSLRCLIRSGEFEASSYHSWTREHCKRGLKEATAIGNTVAMKGYILFKQVVCVKVTSTWKHCQAHHTSSAGFPSCHSVSWCPLLPQMSNAYSSGHLHDVKDMIYQTRTTSSNALWCSSEAHMLIVGAFVGKHKFSD